MIQPKLRRFDLTMIIISLVIGVGIFRTPSTVAHEAGSVSVFYVAWIFGGIVSICGALTFAEIGARLPAAGGYYKIFSAAYHPAYAFMLNWSQVIINAGSSAGVAIIGAEYIQPVLFPSAANPDTTIKIVAVLLILVLFAINFAGIKMGARTQNFLSMLKIIMILVFCTALFGPHATLPEAGNLTTTDHSFMRAFGFALISIFFTYGGYQQTVNFGADIQDPQKNIPAAIFRGMLIVIILYLLLNVTYLEILGFDGMANSPLLAAAIAGTLFGEAGSQIASIVLFISVMGFLNTSVMSNPRVYYAMADDKILPPVFKNVNTKTQTQEFGLTFFIAVMILSIFILGSFDKIVNYVIFIDSISLASAAVAIFNLRNRSTAQYAGFQLKSIWKYVVPVTFTIVLLFVTYNTVLSDKRSAGFGFLIFVMGLPLFYLIRYLLNEKRQEKHWDQTE